MNVSKFFYNFSRDQKEQNFTGNTLGRNDTSLDQFYIFLHARFLGNFFQVPKHVVENKAVKNARDCRKHQENDNFPMTQEFHDIFRDRLGRRKFRKFQFFQNQQVKTRKGQQNKYSRRKIVRVQVDNVSGKQRGQSKPNTTINSLFPVLCLLVFAENVEADGIADAVANIEANGAEVGQDDKRPERPSCVETARSFSVLRRPAIKLRHIPELNS